MSGYQGDPEEWIGHTDADRRAAEEIARAEQGEELVIYPTDWRPVDENLSGWFQTLPSKQRIQMIRTNDKRRQGDEARVTMEEGRFINWELISQEYARQRAEDQEIDVTDDEALWGVLKRKSVRLGRGQMLQSLDGMVLTRDEWFMINLLGAGRVDAVDTAKLGAIFDRLRQQGRQEGRREKAGEHRARLHLERQHKREEVEARIADPFGALLYAAFGQIRDQREQAHREGAEDVSAVYGFWGGLIVDITRQVYPSAKESAALKLINLCTELEASAKNEQDGPARTARARILALLHDAERMAAEIVAQVKARRDAEES